MSILVIGLGNPNQSWTPHNIGAELLRLAFGFSGNTFKQNGVFFLVEPDFMNVSGPSIVKFMRNLNLNDLIVIVDDIDTKVGHIVSSYGKSHQ